MNFHRNPRPYLHRRPIPAQARAQTEPQALPAPTLGWVSAQNKAASKKGTAQLLENFFPTKTGIRMMGGSSQHATIGAGPVRSLFNYTGVSSEKMFAADADEIFDVTAPGSPTVAPTASVTGQSSGHYSALNFATSGGYYLQALNGTNYPQLFDGTNWFQQTHQNLSSIAFDTQTGNFTVGQVVSGGTSGATGTLERQTDAGTTGTLYLRNVSGTFQDNEALTDPITGSALANGGATVVAPLISGIDSTLQSLSQSTSYNNRIFMVLSGTRTVYYLPVDSIGGAAGTLTLNGIYKKGGAVLFCATWSLDSGDGLDDKLVVVSTEGEVAVFQGTDPSDPDLWALVGVYEMPAPLGKNAYMKAGGDLLIGTIQGLIPVSQAVVKDRAALALAAVSAPIEPDWVHDAGVRTSIPWEMVKWPTRQMAIIGNPVTSDETTTPPWCYLVNLETGRWAKRTGWNTRTLCHHSDSVFFGDNSGEVWRADTTGLDGTMPYVCKCVYSWDHLGAVGYQKTVTQARAQFTSSINFTPQISFSKDYVVELPAAPSAAVQSGVSSDWDTGVWDTAIWDQGATPAHYNTRWLSIGLSGFVHAPQIQITSGSTATPDAELIVIDYLSERGELVV